MYKPKIVITKVTRQDNLHTLSCPYWIDYPKFKIKCQQEDKEEMTGNN